MRIAVKCFSLIAVIFSLSGCTLSADLIGLMSEGVPSGGIDQVIGPQGDFGYIPQTLPSSISKIEGHFGSISPNKYYFIAPKANSVPRRKIVKIDGANKSEVTLPANVRAQRILYTTQNKIFVLSDEYNGSQTLRYLRMIDKATLSQSPVTCDGYEVALHENISIAETGGNEFYAQVIFDSAISGSGAISHYAFYFNESGCLNTGVYPDDKPFVVGSKIFIRAGTNLHQMSAGSPALTIDLSTYEGIFGKLVHNGDIYYTADRDTGIPWDPVVIRIATSSDNSISIIPSNNNSTGAVTEAYTADGNIYYSHTQSNDVYQTDMSDAPNSITTTKIHETPETQGEVYPVSGTQYFYETSNSYYAVRAQFFVPTGMGSNNLLIDAEFYGEYMHPSGMLGLEFQDSLVQKLGSQYFISKFDSTNGQMSLHKVVTNPSFTTVNAFPNFNNPHSVRVHKNQMYFLAHHEGKVFVYESDGTDGGTAAVPGISSDQYRLDADYIKGGALEASRYFDITKDGSTYFAFLLENETTYLVEYFEGQAKYISIPGAIYDNVNSSIVKVENNKLYFSTPSHYMTGVTANPVSRPGQQLYVYDGNSISTLLKDDWSFESMALKGTDSTLIGTQDLLLNLRSPYKAAGSYFSKAFAMSGGSLQEISVNNGALSGTNSQDDFVFWLSNAGSDTGLYLRKSGVNQKLTTNLNSARYFRWSGDQVYFVGVDSGDSQTYIWHFDSSEPTPAVNKALASPVSVASHNEDIFSQFTFSVGTDHYFLFPTTTSTFTDPKYTLWRANNGSIIAFSDEIISEAISTPVSYFFISSPQTGPQAGQKALLKIAASGATRSSYFATTLFGLRPGPSGIYFTDGVSIYKTNSNLTVEGIGTHYGPAVDSAFYNTNVEQYLPMLPNNMLNGMFGISITDTTIVNLGIANTMMESGSLYRNFTGEALALQAFPDPSLNAFGLVRLISNHKFSSARIDTGSAETSYAPQSNSLLYVSYISSVKTYLVAGQSGLLAITF